MTDRPRGDSLRPRLVPNLKPQMLPSVTSTLLFVLVMTLSQPCGAQPAERTMIVDRGNFTERVEVAFPYKAFELDEKDRVGVAGALASVRRDWCYVEVVIAAAHSDASEGTALQTSELAKRRAQTLYEFLLSLGVHETLLYVQARGASNPLHPTPNHLNARAEMEVVGRKCSDGFRADSADPFTLGREPVQTVRPWQEVVK